MTDELDECQLLDLFLGVKTDIRNYQPGFSGADALADIQGSCRTLLEGFNYFKKNSFRDALVDLAALLVVKDLDKVPGFAQKLAGEIKNFAGEKDIIQRIADLHPDYKRVVVEIVFVPEPSPTRH